MIGDVRGRGAMVAMELVTDPGSKEPDPDRTAKIIGNALQEGLLLLTAGPLGNVVRVLVPFAVTDDQLEEGLEILGRAVDSAAEGSGEKLRPGERVENGRLKTSAAILRSRRRPVRAARQEAMCFAPSHPFEVPVDARRTGRCGARRSRPTRSKIQTSRDARAGRRAAASRPGRRRGWCRRPRSGTARPRGRGVSPGNPVPWSTARSGSGSLRLVQPHRVLNADDCIRSPSLSLLSKRFKAY